MIKELRIFGAYPKNENWKKDCYTETPKKSPEGLITFSHCAQMPFTLRSLMFGEHRLVSFTVGHLKYFGGGFLDLYPFLTVAPGLVISVTLEPNLEGPDYIEIHATHNPKE